MPAPSTFGGTRIDGLAPHRICRHGLTRTFQIVQPFAGLTVRENIACGAHLHHAKRVDALARAAEIAAQVGMERMLDQPAQDLTVAGRKRLELARALATEPKLLLLDEVMAGLIPSEVEEIIPTIRKIRDSGVTILLIEHVMQAVMSLSEEAYVINQGRMIAHGTPAALVRDPQVIEAYLGHGAAQRLHESQAGADSMLEIEGLRAATARSRSCTTSPCRSGRARSSPCSARTASARRR